MQFNCLRYRRCSTNDWSNWSYICYEIRYTSQTGSESMFDEADSDFSGRNAAGSSVDGYSSTAHSGVRQPY